MLLFAGIPIFKYPWALVRVVVVALDTIAGVARSRYHNSLAQCRADICNSITFLRVVASAKTLLRIRKERAKSDCVGAREIFG